MRPRRSQLIYSGLHNLDVEQSTKVDTRLRKFLETIPPANLPKSVQKLLHVMDNSPLGNVLVIADPLEILDDAQAKIKGPISAKACTTEKSAIDVNRLSQAVWKEALITRNRFGGILVASTQTKFEGQRSDICKSLAAIEAEVGKIQKQCSIFMKKVHCEDDGEILALIKPLLSAGYILKTGDNLDAKVTYSLPPKTTLIVMVWLGKMYQNKMRDIFLNNSLNQSENIGTKSWFTNLVQDVTFQCSQAVRCEGQNYADAVDSLNKVKSSRWDASPLDPTRNPTAFINMSRSMSRSRSPPASRWSSSESSESCSSRSRSRRWSASRSRSQSRERSRSRSQSRNQSSSLIRCKYKTGQRSRSRSRPLHDAEDTLSSSMAALELCASLGYSNQHTKDTVPRSNHDALDKLCLALQGLGMKDADSIQRIPDCLTPESVYLLLVIDKCGRCKPKTVKALLNVLRPACKFVYIQPPLLLLTQHKNPNRCQQKRPLQHFPITYSVTKWMDLKKNLFVPESTKKLSLVSQPDKRDQMYCDDNMSATKKRKFSNLHLEKNRRKLQLSIADETGKLAQIRKELRVMNNFILSLVSFIKSKRRAYSALVLTAGPEEKRRSVERMVVLLNQLHDQATMDNVVVSRSDLQHKLINACTLQCQISSQELLCRADNTGLVSTMTDNEGVQYDFLKKAVEKNNNKQDGQDQGILQMFSQKYGFTRLTVQHGICLLRLMNLKKKALTERNKRPYHQISRTKRPRIL